MVDNENGLQHRRNLRGESLSDVAPGQLPRDRYGQATLVAEDQDEVLGHPTTAVTLSSRDSPPVVELPIDRENELPATSEHEPHNDPEDRLYDTAPQSPQISTMDSPPGNEVRYITEEDSMPPTLREARPFLRSTNSLVASAAASNMGPSLRDLHAVLADTSQTEAEMIMAAQEASNRMHAATMDMQQAAEHLHVTRSVSQTAQRYIQQSEGANRVIGNREQVGSQQGDHESPTRATFGNSRRRHAAQRAAAGNPAMNITTQAARSHSHPSRRDESRTDQSSPSSSSSNMFSTAYLGPLNPRASELFPSALDVRDRIMMGSRNVFDHMMMEAGGGPGARENLHPAYNSTSNSQQAGMQTSSTRNPPVFANLTNAVERPSRRAPGHRSSSDGRSFLGRPQPSEFTPENYRRASHNQRRPQSPWDGLEEWEQNVTGLPTPLVSPPIGIEEASRRLPDASSSRPMTIAEINRHIVESNAWNPHSSGPEPSVEFANANPFGSRSSANQLSNPLMTGARTLYLTDRSRTNMLRGTTGQDVVNMKPPPRTKAEMTVDMECKICMEQPATVACLPCGNLNNSQFLSVASLTICRSLRDVQMVLRCSRAE